MAVQGLPRDLPKTFSRILEKLSQTQETRFARQIFEWLAVAKRPLTTEELREAVAIDPLKSDLDASNLVNDMTQSFSCCGCFILVDEEQETVHFTHHSVRHYLLSEALDLALADYHVDLTVAEKYAGEACIAYLNFGIFDRRVAKAPAQGTKLANIPSAIAHHMIPKNKVATEIAALSLLANQRMDQKTLNVAVQQQLEGVAYQSPRHNHFLAYASKWWIWHTKRLDYRNKRLWNMWSHLFTDNTGKAEKIWDPQHWAGYGFDEGMLHWAAMNNHNALLEYMLVSGSINDPKVYNLVLDVVVRKAKSNEWDFSKIFLERLSTHQDYDDVRTMLLVLAAWHGKVEVIQYCLSYGAHLYKTHDMSVLRSLRVTLEAPRFASRKLEELFAYKNRDILCRWSPLSIAAAGGHIDVTEFIISRPSSKEILFAKRPYLPEALLVSAAYNQSELACGLLNIWGKDRRFISDDDDTGYEVKVRRKFNVNYVDNNKWTPLMYAVAHSNVPLIELLLNFRAAYGKGDEVGDQNVITPVRIASLTGRDDIRQFLLHDSKYTSNHRKLPPSFRERAHPNSRIGSGELLMAKTQPAEAGRDDLSYYSL